MQDAYTRAEQAQEVTDDAQSAADDCDEDTVNSDLEKAQALESSTDGDRSQAQDDETNSLNADVDSGVAVEGADFAPNSACFH